MILRCLWENFSGHYRNLQGAVARGGIISFMAVCLCPQVSSALDFQLFPFDPALSKYIQEYHQHPNPEKALDYFFTLDIEQFENKATEHNQPHSRGILMAFFVNVLGENPDQVLPFTQRLTKESSRYKAAVGAEIVAYGAAENRKEALALIVTRYSLPAEYATKLEGMEVLPYPRMTATDWQVLDILWACYFATAKDVYIEKIAGPLVYWQVPDEEYKKRLRGFEKMNPAPGTKEHQEWIGIITAQSTLMGLTINAAKYPTVFASLTKLSEQRQDRVGEVAKKIINSIRKKKAETQDAP